MIKELNTKVLAFILLFLMMFAPVSKTVVAEIDELPKTALAKVDAKQIQCMAKNIFYEAGSESIKGQAAVARVVLNRVSHGFGKTPCAVIYQSTNVAEKKVCQFSWVCEGKTEPNKNSYKYKVAQQVAYDVMVHDKYNDVIPKSVLFFHNLTVAPLWQHHQALQIGNHIFYSKVKKKIIPEKKDLTAENI